MASLEYWKNPRAPQDLPNAPHFSVFSSLLSALPVLHNETLTKSLPNLIKELGTGLREHLSIMEPSQRSNELPASPRFESQLQRHPSAGVSTGPSETEEVTHHSGESSRLQYEDLYHQDEETSELMISQPQGPTRQALIDEKQRPIPAGKTASWYTGWSIEIACIILSAAVLVGIAIFLLEIRGRLLASWKIIIKPNTVLSILSTAFKATVLVSVASSIGQSKWIYLSKKSFGLEQLQIFDDATRGPWGALVFFWKARRYGTVIAYVGCIVTIAAIALDPFSQELLSFDPTPTQVDGVSSSVPRSQIYDVFQESDPANGAWGKSNLFCFVQDSPIGWINRKARYIRFFKQRSKSSQILCSYETRCYNKQLRTVYTIRQSPRRRSPVLVQTAHIPLSHRLASSEHVRT